MVVEGEIGYRTDEFLDLEGGEVEGLNFGGYGDLVGWVEGGLCKKEGDVDIEDGLYATIVEYSV